MKKILTLLLIMALAVTVLASCDKIPDKLKFWEKPAEETTDHQPDNQPDDQPAEKPAADADLKAAYDFVHNTVKDIAESTNANYTLPGVAPVKDLKFTVTWTVSDNRITLETSEDGTQVTVVVPEPGDADIAYTLKFVVTNAKGETLSREYNHIVPKFKVNTYAEYRAAEDGDSLVVEGVVYGIMSKTAGDAENSIFVQDLTCGGGYYVYQLSDDEVAKVALGQTVKVKGNKKAYYDLPEIVDATVEVIKTETTTLTPSDITEVYKSVDNATDKDSPLLDYVGGYITIKGVTLLEAGTNGYYYFELDGVKTYFRISSSSNCSTKDDETKIKNNHSDYFYYTADITGIATLYKSGEDYWFNVMPLDANMLSNFSEEMQPMPDDVKANFIADKLTTPSEMVSTNSVTLPLVGTGVVDMSVFENVDIAWDLAETANATLVDGVLTAVLPESGSVNVTLTAKVIVNDTEVEKTFTIAVKKLVPLTITEANAKAEEGGSDYTADKFIVEGFITKIASDKYGNVYIKDADGNELYVYGIYSAYGDLRFDAMKAEGAVPQVGDKVVLYGVLGTYTDKQGVTTIQMKNAWLLSWEHIHTYTTQGETVEPSCVQGYTVYSCYCGATENRDFTDAVADHDYKQVVGWHPEMVAADCVTVGVDVYMCYGCYDYYTQQTAIDPNAHAFWGDSEVLTEPDCVNKTNGMERVSCANGCGATEDQEVSYYWAHDWDVQVDTYPTCTEDGAYYAVCTLCEEVETEDRPAEGHWSWNYNVTCGDTDVCEGCGVEYVIQHNTAFSPATCTEAAYCMRCWSYVGEPLGHDWDETDPTSVCSVCGLSNHTCDFSVKGETVNPTCTEGGYTVYGCSVEGCTATENKDETNPTNHEGTTENKDAVAPTCSAVGYTAGVYCTACQTWLEGHEEQAIVADAHTNVDGDAFCDGCNVIVNYGTLEAPLTTTQADAVAEYYKDQYTDTWIYSEQKFYVTGTVISIGSIGNYYSKVYITDGTTEFYIYSINLGDGVPAFTKGDVITAHGYIAYAYSEKEMTGKGSDYTYALSVVPHTHNYSEGACDATSVCSICNAAKGDHSYDEGVVTTPATCLAEGTKTYTCDCTATKTETIAPLEHSYTGEGGACVNGCGQTEGNAPAPIVEKKVSFTIAEVAASNNWATQTKYTSLTVDGITFVAAGTDSNTGKYYSTGAGSWRFYSSGNATLTITVPEGNTIKSVKITWSEGGLKYGSTSMTSGTAVNVEGNSVVISASAKTFITAIEVVYEGPAA